VTAVEEPPLSASDAHSSHSVGETTRNRTAAPQAGQRVSEQLLTELRGAAARADTKASVLVGTQGMTAAATVAFLAEGGWRPSSLSGPAQAVWWAGAVCFVLSLGSLLLAVVPRYGTASWRPGMPVTYFVDICSASRHGRDALLDALRETERAPMQSLITSLTANSRIVARKHWWIRASLASISAAAVLLPGALVIG
jgi:hypothetical protein